jgi:hypothetical protein
MLHVPFVSTPEFPFTEELTETVSGCTIFIGPDINPYKRLVVKEIDTIDRAHDQFSALKRGMLAASLNVCCGIRIKDDLTVVDNDDKGLPGKPDLPFVCQQGRSLARITLTIGEPKMQISKVLPKVIRGLEMGIEAGFAVKALRDQRVRLACDLYTDSFFEKSLEASFITLIGVLEVLKDQDSVSPNATQLIDHWLINVHHLESTEAESLRGQLGHMKQISIRRGIGKVVGRHLGQDRAREVQKLYTVRSKLMHNGERPTDLEDNLRYTQLTVRELLASILLSGSR